MFLLALSFVPGLRNKFVKENNKPRYFGNKGGQTNVEIFDRENFVCH